MRGIHVNWTAPYFARNKNATRYDMEDYDIITNIAAALYWRKHNGSAELYTDDKGQEYYHSIGLDDVYDLINTSILEEYARTSVDPAAAPCSGRMQVLSEISAPYVAMDIDLVFFKKLPKAIYESEFRFFHWEVPSWSVYSNAESLFVPEGFSFDPDWEFETMIPNIAALYISQEVSGFWKSFASRAVEYVERSIRQGSSMKPMDIAIFADQRMLGMELRKQGIDAGTFLREVWLCSGNRSASSKFGDFPRWVMELNHKPVDRFDRSINQAQLEYSEIDVYHTWLDKFTFRQSLANPEREAFCMNMLVKIRQDFPEYLEKILNVASLRKYRGLMQRELETAE